MNAETKLHVQIGEVKTARAGQSLEAILGSCIGIGFLMPKKGIYGLAHALLAKSSAGAKRGGGGRHVDQAIETLLKKMEIQDDERKDLRVFLAGGANMTMPIGTDPARLVGTVNATFARQAIKEARLRLTEVDTGGDHGRRVFIDCTTGDYSIAAIPRLGK